MRSGEGIDAAALRSSDLTDELAQQTGLDRDTAGQSLQSVLAMMGKRMEGTGVTGDRGRIA